MTKEMKPKTANCGFCGREMKYRKGKLFCGPVCQNKAKSERLAGVKYFKNCLECGDPLPPRLITSWKDGDHLCTKCHGMAIKSNLARCAARARDLNMSYGYYMAGKEEGRWD